MKNYNKYNFSVLAANEMFNVRGGEGETTTTKTKTSHTSTAEGEDEDVIL